MSALSNISPIDGRYHRLTAPLQEYFSEGALIRYRVRVEVEYFVALCQLPLPQLRGVGPAGLDKVRRISTGFGPADALRVKEIESKLSHDIKAAEYFIKERFDALGLGKYREFVHFGLTSQDVNNTAMPLSLKDALDDLFYPLFRELLDILRNLSDKWIGDPMLARTHGQPATPTTMGKEIMVFGERLKKQVETLKALPVPAKFGGATGNMNAHHLCYPEIDWFAFADRFTASLGLERSRVTTQIDHYDQLAAMFDAMKRICTILIDMDRDFWSYISLEYFTQKVAAGEVGSSAMPHKVNPIDFENAEGNAGVAIALLSHMAETLPVSRLQRDLSDSTVLRNAGVAAGHMLLALKSTIRGLQKITLNREATRRDLEKNAVVVAEGIQSLLRTMGYPEPYEALKKLTRGNVPVSMEQIHRFIEGLDIADEQKKRLKNVTPFNYTGIIPGKRTEKPGA